MFGMSMTVFWLLALILFAVIEGVTFGLTSIWFALGALVSMIIAAFGGPLWLQITLFFVVSAVVLWLVRPFAKKYVTPRKISTNADRVIGMTGIVTQAIDNLAGTGEVSVGGIIWTARTEDGGVIAKGEQVRILRIEGVRLFVSRAETAAKAES